ncbi:hypothetical protein [Caballeronia cordobensis]|uniref:hypothetical protein n=1 Tax=Caballeronia cordobensis TaxID=1353886 RepID=UPI00045F048A|nr:hypothetical protein BRPE67_CCDS07240 [Burkholderia sp. RPE67]
MTVIATLNGGRLPPLEVELLVPMGDEPASIALYVENPNPHPQHQLWNHREDGTRYAVDQQVVSLQALVDDCLLLSGASCDLLKDLAATLETCALRIRLSISADSAR